MHLSEVVRTRPLKQFPLVTQIHRLTAILLLPRKYPLCGSRVHTIRARRSSSSSLIR
jgi:hypothetical protein